MGVLHVWSLGYGIVDEGCKALSRTLEANQTLTDLVVIGVLRSPGSAMSCSDCTALLLFVLCQAICFALDGLQEKIPGFFFSAEVLPLFW